VDRRREKGAQNSKSKEKALVGGGGGFLGPRLCDEGQVTGKKHAAGLKKKFKGPTKGQKGPERYHPREIKEDLSIRKSGSSVQTKDRIAKKVQRKGERECPDLEEKAKKDGALFFYQKGEPGNERHQTCKMWAEEIRAVHRRVREFSHFGKKLKILALRDRKNCNPCGKVVNT